MKLLRCFVENFGKLSKESIEFESGLCCIYKENGSGKTTLAVFIKAMLFGLEVSTKKKLDENERNKYRPWSGLSYGGWLEFYSDSLDKSFRVTRFFGEKASLDTCEIIDLSTGLDATDIFEKGQIGQKLFGIDETGFEQTLFLSERDVEIKNSGSLTTKISALASGDDDSYEVAVKILDAKRKYYKNAQGRGRLTDLEDELYKKEKEYESLCALSDSISIKQEALNSAKLRVNELEELVKKQKSDRYELTKAIELKIKRQRLEDIEKRLADVSFSTEEVLKRYQNGIPDENTLSGLEEDISRLEDQISKSRSYELEGLMGEIERLEKMLWDVKIPREDISEAIEKYSKITSNSLSTLENQSDAVNAGIRAIQKKYPHGLPTSDELARLVDIDRQIFELKQKNLELSEEYFTRIKEDRKISHKSNVALLCTVMWILSALSVLPAILVSGALWVLTAALGAVSAFLTFKCISKPGMADTSEFERFESERDGINEEIDALDEEKQGIFEKYSIKADTDPKLLDEDLKKLKDAKCEAKELDQRLSVEKAEVESLTVEFKDLMGGYAIASDPKRALLDLSGDLDMLVDKKKRATALEDFQKALDSEILRLFDRIRTKIFGILIQMPAVNDTQTARSIVSAMKNDVLTVAGLEKDKVRLQTQLADQSIDISGFEALLSESVNSLEERADSAQKELEATQKELEATRLGIASGEASLETLIEKCEDITAVWQEICVLKEKLQTLSGENYAVCMALEHLEKAKNSLSSRYVKAIEENFTNLLTSADNRDVKLDTKLSLKVEREGMLRDVAYFSRGQRDVIDFSLRMALVKTLFEGGERPFIILDDPFSALDSTNFEAAAETVRALAADHQIIYTVCSQQREIRKEQT